MVRPESVPPSSKPPAMVMLPPWLLMVVDVLMKMFPPADLSESAHRMIGPLLVCRMLAVPAEVVMPLVDFSRSFEPEVLTVRLPLVVTSVP